MTGWVAFGRGDWIRTSDLFVPNEARYQTALRPDLLMLRLLRRVGNPSISSLSGEFIRWILMM